MKRAEALSVLIEAAEQVPPSPRLRGAIHAVKKTVKTHPEVLSLDDYKLLLANTGRALADGMKWAYEMREANPSVSVAKLLPVVREQNRRAIKLLEAHV